MGLFDQVGSDRYEDDLIYHEEQKRKEEERERANSRYSYTNNSNSRGRNRIYKKSNSFGLSNILSIFGWIVFIGIMLKACGS